MPPQPPAIPHVVPSPDALDDLELLRAGVDLFNHGDAPLRVLNPGQNPVIEILEPEGVPMARLEVETDQAGSATVQGVQRWLSARPERPFEHLHRAVADVPAPSCVLIPTGCADWQQWAQALRCYNTEQVLVLLPAAVERDGAAAARDVARVRDIVGAVSEWAIADPSVGTLEVVVVPLAQDHPHHAERLAACAAAYSRGAPVIQPATAETDKEADRQRPRGAVLFLTGLSGSGKSTLAKAVRNRLLERSERAVTLLDGDVVRRQLSAGLGFGAADRDTNIRRIGWVAARIAEHGGLTICSPIAPFAATRNDVQQMVTQAGGRFVLIHIATPLQECERRDRKGLYARARRGEIPDFTGISSPYETPASPDLRIDTTGQSIEPLVEQILSHGERLGLWDGTTGSTRD